MFPKRKSRTIKVGGRQYRWLVSIAVPNERLTVRVQKDVAGPACQLQADVYEGHCGGTVTPAMVESLITASLAEGWDPDKTGTFRVDADRAASMLV